MKFGIFLVKLLLARRASKTLAMSRIGCRNLGAVGGGSGMDSVLSHLM